MHRKIRPFLLLLVTFAIFVDCSARLFKIPKHHQVNFASLLRKERIGGISRVKKPQNEQILPKSNFRSTCAKTLEMCDNLKQTNPARSNCVNKCFGNTGEKSDRKHWDRRMKRTAPFINGIRPVFRMSPAAIAVCPTEVHLAQPVTGEHWLSRESVLLYRNASSEFYYQSFQIGLCTNSSPIFSVRIPEHTDAVCRPLKTKHLAFFYLNEQQVNSEVYSNISCKTDQPGRFLCRDWVYLPTECKLFA
ncbi:uncharacterized protein LOC108950948 [Ciona intestinalis]